MILELWITLLALAFLMIFLGTQYPNTISDVLLVVGWGFVFILGGVMMLGNVSQVVGSSDSIFYSYDGDGRVNATYINSSYVYQDFVEESGSIIETIANKRVFGFFIMILGMIGQWAFWFDARKNPLEEDGFDGGY
jgi:uncharacterized membrane protein